MSGGFLEGAWATRPDLDSGPQILWPPVGFAAEIVETAQRKLCSVHPIPLGGAETGTKVS